MTRSIRDDEVLNLIFQGFRTGYLYRHPLVKGEIPKPKNDVEVPPAVSSLGYLLEEEEMYRSGQVLFKIHITQSENKLETTCVFPLKDSFLIPSSCPEIAVYTTIMVISGPFFLSQIKFL